MLIDHLPKMLLVQNFLVDIEECSNVELHVVVPFFILSLYWSSIGTSSHPWRWEDAWTYVWWITHHNEVKGGTILWQMGLPTWTGRAKAVDHVLLNVMEFFRCVLNLGKQTKKKKSVSLAVNTKSSCLELIDCSQPLLVGPFLCHLALPVRIWNIYAITAVNETNVFNTISTRRCSSRHVRWYESKNVAHVAS